MDKELGEIGLGRSGVLVLALERGPTLLETVGANTRVEPGDRVIAYGDTKVIKSVAKGRFVPQPPPTHVVQELLTLGGGAYQILSVEVDSAALVGRSLRDLQLTREQILVLAIRRESEFIPTPEADFTLQAGDRLVCYGPVEKLERFAGIERGDA